jgi:PAS domain S-box-containing protein
MTMDLKKLFHKTADGVFAVDAKGHIVYWNDSCERILGYRATEVVGRNCCDTIKGRDHSGNLACYKGCQVMTALKDQRLVEHFEMLVPRKDDKEVWVDVGIIYMMPDSRGDPLSVHIIRRSREKDHVEEAVQAAMQRAGWSTAATALRASELPRLTPREREVLLHLAEGKSTVAIAKDLGISPNTARNHIQNLMDKLGVQSRVEAVCLAIRHRLFPWP